MNDLPIKIGLAIFAFILGLLSTYITATMQKDDGVIAYAIEEKAIIDVRPDNDKDEFTKYYSENAKNVSRFIVTLDNIGDLVVKDFNSLFVGGVDSEIVSHTIKTKPDREVFFNEDSLKKKNELRIKNITLDVNQSLILELTIVSDKKPKVRVYFSGGKGGVEWRRVTEPFRLTLQDNIIKLFVLLIALVIIPGLISGIPKAIGFFFYGLSKIDGERVNTSKLAMTVTSSEFIASLIRYYILFLMIVPFTSVAKEISSLLERDPKSSWTVNGSTKGESSPIIVSEQGDITIVTEPREKSSSEKK